jgi:hypothetical protein
VLGEQPLQLTGTLSVLHASTSHLRQPTTKKPAAGLTAGLDKLSPPYGRSPKRSRKGQIIEKILRTDR